MKAVITIFLAAVIIMVLCIAGLGIKTLVRRNGELKRHCAGMDPYSGKRNGCICASQQSTLCNERKAHPYQPLDVNENLMEEVNPTKK